MREADRHTVYDRSVEEFSRQFTFDGVVVAKGEDRDDADIHYTVVYQMFDGNYVLEHYHQAISLLEASISDGYEIVPATKLRPTVLTCWGLIPFQIGDQLGLEITDADFPPPPPPPEPEPEEE